MANELSLSATLAFTKSGVTINLSKTTTNFNVSGSKYTKLMQTIGTSEEALDLGDVGTAGYSLIINRDATNFVKIRPATAAADCIKLKPGEFALFRHAGAAPFAIADTGACVIEHLLIED